MRKKTRACRALKYDKTSTKPNVLTTDCRNVLMNVINVVKVTYFDLFVYLDEMSNKKK